MKKPCLSTTAHRAVKSERPGWAKKGLPVPLFLLPVLTALFALLLALPVGASVPITRVSVKGDGSQISGSTSAATISAGGDTVCFSSGYQLISADTNFYGDVYTNSGGIVSLVTRSWDGGMVNASCNSPFISPSGATIAFDSAATNLVQSGNPGNRSQVWASQGGSNMLISHSLSGQPGNGYSGPVRGVSSGGAILFTSSSTDMVSNPDTNGGNDLYVAGGGQMTLVDVSTGGAAGNQGASTGSMSADGAWVSFASSSTDIVANDTNNRVDLFVRSLSGGETTRIMGVNGAEPNGSAGNSCISADGSYVLFASNASNLVPNDTNNRCDIFLWCRATGVITRVSVSSSGAQANGDSEWPQISGDGEVCVFQSTATNLVAGDTNLRQDIFAHSMVTGETVRLSVSASGTEGNQLSEWPRVSLDGGHVVFSSIATNLISGDSNNSEDLFLTDSGASGGSTSPWRNGPSFGLFPFSRFTDDPVNTSSGNATYSVTDLALPGVGLPLSFARTYNSQDSQTSGPLGYGWNHTYSAHLEFPSSSVVTLVYADGHRGYFTATTGGDYTSPASTTDRLHKNANGSYTLTALDQSCLEFSSMGDLSSLADRYGNQTSLTHNGLGELTSVADSGGRSLTLTYASGKISSVEDSALRLVSYGYDGSGNLATVTDANGHVTTYAYDANHQLTSISEPIATTRPLVTNTYTLDRVTKQTDALGNETDLAYNAASQETIRTDGRGKTWIEAWDASYRLTGETDPCGHSGSITYNAAGFPSTLMDARGKETSYTYDALGNLTSATDPEGHEVEVSYDTENSNLLWYEDAADHRTTFTWDESGTFLDSLTTPAGTTSFTHYANGRLQTLTDARSHSWDFAYNAAGDLTSVTDPLDHTTTYEHDQVGRTTAVEDANSSRTEFAYDDVGNLTKITDPLKEADPQNRHEIDLAYDDNDNLTSIQDQKSNLTEFAYNDMNLLVSATDALDNQASFTYDENYNLTGVSDPLSHTTTYAYDDADRLHSVTDPTSQVTEFAYDPAGNVTEIDQPNGKDITLSYFDDDLLQEITSSGEEGSYTFAYNPTHTLSSVQDQDEKTWSYTYDTANRLTGEEDENNSALGAFTVARGYDAVSNLTSLTVGSLSAEARTYNARNELATLTAAGGETSFTYDAGGRRTGVETPEDSTRTYAYDAAGRVSTLTNLTASGTQGFEYEYDANGNLLSENDATYLYDALNRLTSWYDPVEDLTTTYTYDDAGNLTGVAEEETTTESYTHNASNEITNSGFTYDENGNLTSDGARTYLYDALGRLKEVKEGETSIALMTYDFMNRRTSLTTGGATTYFHYDGPYPVAESDEEGDLVATYVYDDAGQPLSMTRGEDTYFYQLNGHGDVVSLTDGQGQVANSYRYDPWGKILQSSETVSNPFRYAGYRYDSATGLYYLWHRYYDPGLRRFLTVDPAVLLTNERYSYCGENPLAETDPAGLSWYHLVPWDDRNPFRAATYNGDVPEWVNNFNPIHVAVTGYYNAVQAARGGCSWWTSFSYGIQGAAAVESLLAPFMLAGTAPTGGLALSGGIEATPAISGESIRFAGDNLAHIFRSVPGHLAEDTLANRALLQGAVRPENFVKSNAVSGVSTYRQLLPSGQQVWVEVRDGLITNGGVNVIPRSQ